MGKVELFLLPVIKRIVFFFVPLWLLLFVVYELIFDLDMGNAWHSLTFYISLISLTNFGGYRHKMMEEPIPDFEMIETYSSARWKTISNTDQTFVFRPRFDFPYNLMSGETVKVDRVDGKVKVEGPAYYVDSWVRDYKGKRNPIRNRFALVVIPAMVIVLLLAPILYGTGVIADWKIMYHNHRARDVDRIVIADAAASGNTENNSINDGFAVTYADRIFWVRDNLDLVSISDDFQEQNYLIDKTSGSGISRLNIVESWIFYTEGKILNRMRLDGTEKETIYKAGYLLDVHVIGNDIYFISFMDRFAVHRMDVNGQNLERFIDKDVIDIAIIEGRLFYSYEEDGTGALESLDLDGKNRKLELEKPIQDLVYAGDTFYFLGFDDNKLYSYSGEAGTAPAILVDEPVSSYIAAEEGIYYSLFSKEGAYPGNGLYKLALDGSKQVLLDAANSVENLSQTDEWLLITGYDSKHYLFEQRLNLLTDELSLMP